jgi:hypothetical protein
MKNTTAITRTNLLEILKNWGFGCQTASIQYITSANLTPAGKARFGDVRKVANVHCMIGYDYENAVNNQREREDEIRNFMAEQLWKGAGKRVTAALATHVAKGTFYLTYKKIKTMKSFYFDSEGNQISVTDLIPYFKPESPSKKQGVVKTVKHREVGLENVLKVKFKGSTHIIQGQ